MTRTQEANKIFLSELDYKRSRINEGIIYAV